MPHLRPALPGDMPALRTLYAATFPDEDLTHVVHALLAPDARALNFCLADGARLIGHVAFTRCGVGKTPACVTLLGPLGVHPDHQGHGIGTTLVRTGLNAARRHGAAHALVLGDPGYYGRFGFRAERRVRPPYPLPRDWRDAWQGLALSDVPPRGTLRVPTAWRSPALWRD